MQSWLKQIRPCLIFKFMEVKEETRLKQETLVLFGVLPVHLVTSAFSVNLAHLEHTKLSILMLIVRDVKVCQ